MARPRPHKRAAPHQTPARRVTLSIAEIGARGDGVAAIGGEQVYVPFTAPGDVVEVALRGRRGRLKALKQASSHRVEAPCRHFGTCGGCALQHVSPDYSRHWKRSLVTGMLAREGLDPAIVAAPIVCPAASRRRATFRVERIRDGVRLGFNVRKSDALVDIAECPILAPDLAARLGDIRALAAAIPYRVFDMAATLCDNGLDVDIQRQDADYLRGHEIEMLVAWMEKSGCVRQSLNGEIILELQKPVVRFDGLVVTPPPGGFLQASKEGEAALIALVKDGVKDARKIVDLFSGCGSFALPLARSATVFAVDADPRALAALIEAAAAAQRRGAGVNPVRTETRNLFERPLLATDLNEFDAVVFDPPRAGAKAQAEQLAESRVPVVVGVSCEAATFARDAAILARGGYRLEAVTPVDQFVYSPHIELAGVFTRD